VDRHEVDIQEEGIPAFAAMSSASFSTYSSNGCNQDRIAKELMASQSAPA